jgi:hypothetical protein
MRDQRERPDYNDDYDLHGSCGTRSARGRPCGPGCRTDFPGLNAGDGRPPYGER